jgi:prepilin peptidase CpaA
VLNLILNFTLLTIISLAALFDIRERRIPNWLILVGLTSGVILTGLHSSGQFFVGIIGFAAAILSLMIPFAFGWVGAGDVKLLGVVGALLGYQILPRVFFYSCIVAGVLALAALALGHVRQVSFRTFWIECKFIFLTSRVRLPKNKPVGSRSYSVPWGAAIGAGTIMAYYLDPLGSLAGF